MNDKTHNATLAKALPDEPIFALLGRDRHAPNVIVEWTTARFEVFCDRVSKRLQDIVTPGNADIFRRDSFTPEEQEEYDLIQSALTVANDMTKWRAAEITKAGDGLPRWKGERESLVEPKVADGFSTESPLRAFSSFTAGKQFAIGKGFRASLAHLVVYLDALEMKEGWMATQIILPDNDAADPTIVFRRVPQVRLLLDSGVSGVQGEVREANDTIAKYFPPSFDGYMSVCPDLPFDPKASATVKHPAPPPPIPYASPTPVLENDPVHPPHYGGTACMDIIDHMPANVGLAAKYIWRLGEKDAIAIEIGKLVVYLERQIALETATFRAMFGFAKSSGREEYRVMAMHHINERGMGAERATAMSALVNYTVSGNPMFLRTAIGEMESLLDAKPDGSTGLAL